MALRQKVDELQDYKDRRRRERDIHNLKERMLLDQLSEAGRQRQARAVVAGPGNRDRLPLSKDKDVKKLQIEYERMRERGKVPIANDPFTFGPKKKTRKPVYAPPDQPRYNPHADPKVQQLAESHGRQMEFLQNRNRDLERQREEIRRRLEELGRRPVEKDNSTEELLRELREQEARNQRLLDELKQQLMNARRPINIIRQEAQPEKKSFIYPVYYGNSLVAEIVAVRQAYLQNGGNDPDILAQLAQMQAEAQAIDDSMRNAQKKQPKERKDGLPPHLLTMEMENERLQRQLLLLQEQKLISTNRRKDNREDELERDIQRLQRDHLRKMYELQRQMERLRQETIVDRMRLEFHAQQQPTKIILQQQGPPPQPQPQPQPQLTQRAYVDLDTMVPYDQYYSPRRVQAYGHTWVHTQHRQDTTGDPYYDIQL